MITLLGRKVFYEMDKEKLDIFFLVIICSIDLKIKFK
jgi:hypothetical protein